MASSEQSVDELIAQLVGMGFEFQDAQEAIQAGKLSVTDAIEWIVAGKPAVQSSGASVLKLGGRKGGSEGSRGEPIGANPFSNPQSLSPPPAASSSQASSSAGAENPPQDDGVVSRTRMNDEQRKIRDRFEQKQRDEARKSVKQERVSTKKAHDAILKQIQEDREQQKLRRQGHTATSPPQTSAPQLKQSGSEDKPPPEKKVDDAALIQIRLPDGRALREKFAADSTLQDVSNFVENKIKNMNSLIFMQPFPRQEFGTEHMTMSLRDLKLAPSGSLVLKKSDAPQTVSAQESKPSNLDKASGSLQTDSSAPINQDDEQGMDIGPSHPPPSAALPFVHDVLGTHNWGAGHNMMETDQAGDQDAAQAPQQNEENAMEEADSEEDDQGAVGGMPFGGGGAGGFGWGNFAAGGQYGQDDDEGHFEGAGHVLAGQVLNPENMPHHQKSPAQLAAEAARQRYAQPAPAAAQEPEAVAAVIHHNVLPLSQMLIQHVCGRICDTRHPLTGMQGIPADIGIRVVEHLIKEKLLKPKTLHPFVSCRLRKLVLDCYPYTTNELLTALRLHVYITHLGLGSCSLITDRGLQPLIALKRLKHLSLSNCRQLTNNCLPIVAEFSQLTSLNLENTGVTDAGVMEYAQTSPQNLQHLNLSKTQITHTILPALQAIPNLKSLSLELTQVASLSGIQNLSELEFLNLCGTPIVTDALLCLSVQKHPSLTAINISNTPNVNGDLALEYLHSSGLKLEAIQLPSRLSTTDSGIAHLAGLRLKTLDLTNYIQIGDSAMQFVGQIHSLRKLRLSNTKVSDAGLVFLEGLKNLEELHIDRVPTVTDVGASIIKGFSSLQELSLSETGIGNTFLKSKALNECLLLNKLNLSKTQISTRGVVCLSLPHLTLLNLEGTRVRAEVEERLRRQCPQLVRVSLVNIDPVSAVDEETDNW